MVELSISSWSLHRALGPMYMQNDAGVPVSAGATAGSLTLLELPAVVASMGIHTLETCHFHFPVLDTGYLNEFAGAAADAGVRLYSILIDGGDITHPDKARREADELWIRSWLDITAAVGATHARVIAGEAQPDVANEAVNLSAGALSRLATYGSSIGVQVITENFKRLTASAAPLLAILDRCDGKIGLCVDFGNFKGPTKYAEVQAIMPRGTSVHAKGDYPLAGELNRPDLDRCLDILYGSGFIGPCSLIFDGPGDETASLLEIKKVVLERGIAN